MSLFSKAKSQIVLGGCFAASKAFWRSQAIDWPKSPLPTAVPRTVEYPVG